MLSKKRLKRAELCSTHTMFGARDGYVFVLKNKQMVTVDQALKVPASLSLLLNRGTILNFLQFWCCGVVVEIVVVDGEGENHKGES